MMSVGLSGQLAQPVPDLPFNIRQVHANNSPFKERHLVAVEDQLQYRHTKNSYIRYLQALCILYTQSYKVSCTLNRSSFPFL